MTSSLQTEWLTAAEAAFYLRVKPRTLLAWARQGKVRGYRLSGTLRCVWRFKQSDLDATMTASSAAPADTEAA
jgi:excisionase family DNA binding protein